MDIKIKKKNKSLYVEEDLHTEVNALAILKQQNIKTVVSDFLKIGFKTDHFFAYCQDMHRKHIDEARLHKEDPKSFDYYCSVNLEWLKEEFHKSLLD